MAKPKDRKLSTHELLEQLPRALALVWQADRTGAMVLAALTLVQAALPASMAWVAKLILDAVVQAAQHPSEAARALVFRSVGWELGLAVVTLLTGRLYAYLRELLRVNLGNLLNERLLEKALTLGLEHFEDSETYDVMQNARREASLRPLSLALDAVSVVKSGLMLASFAVLLWSISWWSVLVLLLAAVPSFLAETKLSGDAFRLSSWRAPEARRLNYLEWILTRDSHVKEVKLFGLGPTVLGRYRALFTRFLGEDRKLARKRLVLGTLLGVLSLGAFYVCYVLVAARAADGRITVGDLTLYLAVFRQGQAAFESALGTVAAAAENGGAAEVIESLPNKYETMLGGWFEKGHELSGGQWQKLAIARAFMRDAEVLILDEPTAAIDAEAEVALFERLPVLDGAHGGPDCGTRRREADRAGQPRRAAGEGRAVRAALHAAGAGLPLSSPATGPAYAAASASSMAASSAALAANALHQRCMAP